MNLKSFRHWVRQVYATRDEEVDCDQLFQAVSQYVDTEIAGEDVSQLFPGVRHHLEQCAECYDFYLTLRDVAQLEARQTAPEATNIQPS